MYPTMKIASQCKQLHVPNYLEYKGTDKKTIGLSIYFYLFIPLIIKDREHIYKAI